MFLFVFLLVAIALLSLAANWRLFQKMGYEGWKSVIPLYNQFLLFKAVFGNGWLALVVWFMPVIAGFLSVGVLFITARVLHLQAISTLLSMLILIAAVIIVVFLCLKLMFGLARNFHRPASFGWGLLLMPTLFTFLLAFSSSTYKDGSAAVAGDDVISMIIDRADAWLRQPRRSTKGQKDPISLLKELGELHKDGIIDDALYETKKAELLKRI